jgi:hypothetical protein
LSLLVFSCRWLSLYSTRWLFLTSLFVPRMSSVFYREDESMVPRVSASYGDHARPEWYVRRFASQRWRKYLMSLRARDNHKYRLEYGRYICRIWNGPGWVVIFHLPIL